VRWFTKEKEPHLVSAILMAVLGLIGLAVGQGNWLFALLGAWLGMAVGSLVDKARAFLHGRARKRSSLYGDFVRLQQAEVAYSGFLSAVNDEQARQRAAKELELRRRESWWRGLTGANFETELANLFRNRGFAVRRTGGAGDQGVDLVLDKGARKILVQCKAHKRPIGPAIVREL
jgi:hypothetical protein